MKKIPAGIENFKEIIDDQYYYIDKTELINDVMNEKLVFYTRPRRFGKTLNMSMMAEFFDITKDSKEIFNDTNIIKSLYASNMNQYPTIFVSFANAKGD